MNIVVADLDQVRADAITGLDTSGGKWRFVWWITIPTSADVVRLDTLSTVKTPFRGVMRNTEMECRLQKAAPAHTHLAIGYVSATPVLPPLLDRTVRRGIPVSFMLPNPDGGEAPFVFALTGSLPAGLAFAAATRIISGTPTALGTSDLTYMVTDANSETDSQDFEIEVILPLAAAPTVTIGAVASVDEDQTLALTATLVGGTYDEVDYDWQVDSGGGAVVGNGASAAYTPMAVSADMDAVVSVTVTARGTGTNAEDGSSDTASDTEMFTVNNVVLRRLAAPTGAALSTTSIQWTWEEPE